MIFTFFLSSWYRNHLAYCTRIVDYISAAITSQTKVLQTLLRPSVASVNMTADAAASCDPDYGWGSVAF